MKVLDSSFFRKEGKFFPLRVNCTIRTKRFHPISPLAFKFYLIFFNKPICGMTDFFLHVHVCYSFDVPSLNVYSIDLNQMLHSV